MSSATSGSVLAMCGTGGWCMVTSLGTTLQRGGRTAAPAPAHYYCIIMPNDRVVPHERPREPPRRATQTHPTVPLAPSRALIPATSTGAPAQAGARQRSRLPPPGGACCVLCVTLAMHNDVGKRL